MTSFKIIFGFLAFYCCRASWALPSIEFPIEAQLPPVAVVGQPFSFTFSQTTFSSSLSLEYSTEGLPAWLHFKASDRTFNGTPAQADIGDLEFGLVAADHDGNVKTQVHLVVLEISSVRGDQVAFTKQLAASGNFSAPDTLLLYPETFFSLDFSPNIFESDGSKLEFYATSEEHAPLPAWVMFDEDSIKFSGTSPALLTPQSSPQTFSFCLLASQLPSFSQSALYFQIAVTNHILVFVDPIQTFNISAGANVSIPPLIGQLRYDTKPARRDQLINVSSSSPSWLVFEPTDLSFHGTTPQEVENTAFRLEVVDETNNVASIEIQLATSGSNPKEVTAMDLGNLTLTTGQWFNYTLANLSTILSEPDTEITVELGLATPWLTFQQSNVSFQGLVPSIAESDNMTISATVTDNGQVTGLYSLTLLFNNTPQGTTNGNTSNGIKTASPTSSSSSISTAEPNEHRDKSPKKFLALIIAIPIILVLLVCLAVILLVRRQRQRRARRLVSHQSLQEGAQSSNPSDLIIGVRSDSQGEVETWPRPPSLRPRLIIPWAQHRPSTRRPWPFAGNRTSNPPQIRSSWEEMLREIENSHSQSSHDESRLTPDSESDLTDSSVNQSSSRFDTDDDNVPEDLLTSLVLPNGEYNNRIQLNNTASSAGCNGRRTSGLGHGSRVTSSMQNSERATLRQVSLSPQSESPPAVRGMRGLDLIDEPFMSRFRGSPDTRGTISESASNMKSFGKRSISIGSSGHNERDENQLQRTNQHMRKRTSSTPFSRSLWEDEDYTTEGSASNLGNWYAQEREYSTSQVSSRFNREESVVRPQNKEYIRGEAGLTSNAISMRSQQTQGSHSNSLRFI